MKRRKRNSKKKAKSFASVFPINFDQISDTIGKSDTTTQNLAFRCNEMMRSKKSGGTLKSNLGIHASTNSKEVFRSFPRPILEMEHYTKIQASTPRDLLRKQSRFYKQYNSSICEKKSIRYHKIPPRAITC